MQHVPAGGLNPYTRATIRIVYKRICIVDGVVAATGTEPQITRVSVKSAINIHVGIAVVYLAILYLFLHLRSRHHRIWAHLKQIIQFAVLSIAVFDEVATGAVDTLILSDHLAHRLHDQRNATIPGGNQQRRFANRTYHVSLPITALWRLVSFVRRICGLWHTWRLYFPSREKFEEIIHNYFCFLFWQKC